MFGVLYQKSPVRLSATIRLRNGVLVPFDQAIATTLQNAAETVLTQQGMGTRE